MTASIGWLLLFLVPKLHYVPWDGIMIFWRKIWSAVSSIFFSLYLNSCFAHCWVLFGIEIKFHLKENTYTKAYTYIAHWIRSMVFSDIGIHMICMIPLYHTSKHLCMTVSILKRLQELNQDTIRSSSWHPTNEESRSITRWFLALQQQHDRKWFCSTRSRWAVLDQGGEGIVLSE